MKPQNGQDYWVPGVRAVQLLLRRNPDRLMGIWRLKDSHSGRDEIETIAKQLGVEIHTASMKTLNDRFANVAHQGVCARVKPTEYAAWQDVLACDDGLIVAVDQVTDPRNFGAILRSAECLGATAALTTKNRAARLGPIVAKTAAGASEVLPVAMESNLARAIRDAQDCGYQIVGADLDGVSPDRIDFAQPTVIVIGAEGRGLRRLTKSLCDTVVTIPILGTVESLNAASAASVILYEACRQRQKDTK